MDERCPVTVLTGFLGSGKTTLLGRLLADARFARTAVVVNEFGEVGLDHALIASADESIVQLTTGCLCCAMQGDLAATLMGLARRRDAGEIGFDRVVIETSGLADPPPVLHALLADAGVAGRFTLAGVVTLVDAVHGAATLARFEEARRQVGVADAVLFSKTDVAPVAEGLRAVVAGLNGSARLGCARDGLADALTAGAGAPVPAGPAVHTEGIGAAVLERERPVPGAALALWMQALALHAGPALLRVKGLVDIEEMPGRPAVIHGVQHVFAAPEWLPAWPGGVRGTRLVVIGVGLPRWWPLRLLDAIEAEVRDEAALRSGNGIVPGA